MTTPKPSPMPEYHVSPPEPYEASYCAASTDMTPCGLCAWCQFTMQLLARPYRSLCTKEG